MSLSIDWSEFEFTFSRSSGPGGQNVNKVNSRCQLRWNPSKSASLPETVRARFLARFGSRLTTAGELILASDRFRDQKMNQGDCIEKLYAMIAQVERPPIPRKKSQPTRGSQRRRVKAKRERSEIKAGRGRVRRDD